MFQGGSKRKNIKKINNASDVNARFFVLSYFLFSKDRNSTTFSYNLISKRTVLRGFQGLFFNL